VHFLIFYNAVVECILNVMSRQLKSKYKALIILVYCLLVPLQINAEVNNQTLAVLVNINDPESIEITKYYKRSRVIPEKNIFLNFAQNIDSLTTSGFEYIEANLKEKVLNDIQAYALAWRKSW